MGHPPLANFWKNCYLNPKEIDREKQRREKKTDGDRNRYKQRQSDRRTERQNHRETKGQKDSEAKE